MTRVRLAWFALAVGTVALVCAAPALAGLAVTSDRQVTFHAKGPAGLGIDGKGNDVKMAETAGSVDVTVGLGSLRTGIGLRDRHMREKYLETHKYPTAKLHVDKSAIQFPSAGKPVNAKSSGLLTLHGVTKRVPFQYSATGTQQRASVNGHLHVNMNDFKIHVPSYLGVTVKPDVEVVVEFGVKG
jgi:polyisoprenoid-binding protein YceI